MNKDKPLQNVEYKLTGKTGEACIMNGNTWEESRVDADPDPPQDEIVDYKGRTWKLRDTCWVRRMDESIDKGVIAEIESAGIVKVVWMGAGKITPRIEFTGYLLKIDPRTPYHSVTHEVPEPKLPEVDWEVPDD